MRLHFLVEGRSEQKLLEGFLPRLIPKHDFAIYPHQGKGKLPRDPTRRPRPENRGLLDQLPAKLRAWRNLSPETDRVVVLVDADNDDCKDLIARLRDMVKRISPAPQCMFRLAIEEVEAWYLGDIKAIRRAFGKVSRSALKSYNQDSICGTWEIFQSTIGATSDDKVGWAREMGLSLRADEPLERMNSSPSFRSFCRRVREFAGERGYEGVRRKRAGGVKASHSGRAQGRQSKRR